MILASRFGFLAGLGLWIGGTAAGLLLLPLLPPAPLGQVKPRSSLADRARRRIDALLVLALALVALALVARLTLDQLLPPRPLLLCAAALAGMRLLSWQLKDRSVALLGAELGLALGTLLLNA